MADSPLEHESYGGRHLLTTKNGNEVPLSQEEAAQLAALLANCAEDQRRRYGASPQDITIRPCLTVSRFSDGTALTCSGERVALTPAQAALLAMELDNPSSLLARWQT